MPLYNNAIDTIRTNLEQLQNGERPKFVAIGYFTDEQFAQISSSAMRKRRQRVREALPELEALGWSVVEYAAGKYDITRPKAAG